MQTEIDKLLAYGATLQLFDPGELPTMLLAAAVLKTNPPRLRWCAVFPEHQGHVHELAYDTVQAEGAGVSFRNKSGGLVGYIGPYDDSPLEEGPTKELLQRWRAGLAKFSNQADFEQFFNEA